MCSIASRSGSREGQRAQEQRVQDAEDAGVRADGDREHGDRERRVQRAPPPDAQRVASVLRDLPRQLTRRGAHDVEDRLRP